MMLSAMRTSLQEAQPIPRPPTFRTVLRLIVKPINDSLRLLPGSTAIPQQAEPALPLSSIILLSTISRFRIIPCTTKEAP